MSVDRHGGVTWSWSGPVGLRAAEHKLQPGFAVIGVYDGVLTPFGRLPCWFPQKLENKRTRELSEEQLTMLREAVNQFTIEGDLVRFFSRAPRRTHPPSCLLAAFASVPERQLSSAVLLQRRMQTMSIKRLVDIQCYRGKRHRAGLPVRGEHSLDSLSDRIAMRAVARSVRALPRRSLRTGPSSVLFRSAVISRRETFWS